MGSCYCLNPRGLDLNSGKHGAIDLVEFVMHTRDPLPDNFESPEPSGRWAPGDVYVSPKRLGPSGSDDISRTIFTKKKARRQRQALSDEEGDSHLQLSS